MTAAQSSGSRAQQHAVGQLGAVEVRQDEESGVVGGQGEAAALRGASAQPFLAVP